MSGTSPTIGSTPDMLARLKAVLPLRWFPDTTPYLDGLLTGFASVASTLYAMLAYVRLQTRVATVTDSFIDLAALDYCGPRLIRRVGEDDAAFRTRLQKGLLRERATRTALVSVLTDLTGRVPVIVEPARAADTGGYGVACGYSSAGALGSAAMPFQCLVTAYRPLAGDTAIEGQVADADIYAAVAGVMPIATIAWTAISN